MFAADGKPRNTYVCIKWPYVYHECEQVTLDSTHACDVTKMANGQVGLLHEAKNSTTTTGSFLQLVPLLLSSFAAQVTAAMVDSIVALTGKRDLDNSKMFTFSWIKI